MKIFVPGSDIKRTRETLGESQSTFARRFAVVARTVIRWEQEGGHWFDTESPPGLMFGAGMKSPFQLWRDTKQAADILLKQREHRTRTASAHAGGVQ